MRYHPGKHLIATLHTPDNLLLQQYEDFRQLVDKLVDVYNLQKLGEVFHDFSPAGFTGIVCLSESHISILTWPEHGRVNIDVYLSNYLRDNDGTVDKIYEEIKAYFNASVISETVLKR